MDVVYPIDGKARFVFRSLAYLSLAAITVVLIYATYSLLTKGVGVIGSSLVDVEFPPPSLFPIYAKPITILYVSSLVLLYTVLELSRERVRLMSNGTVHVFKLVAFSVGAVAVFELAYNLIFWSGVLAAQAVLGHLNPDTIANPFPDLAHPINVVFATKVASALLIGAAYVFYYLSRVQESKMRIPQLSRESP